MAHHIENIHTAGNDPRWNMPYTPAIRVRSGSIVFLAGVTAAGIYHSHPHVESEFDDVPTDPGSQARLTMENLSEVLQAAGGSLTDIVNFTKFMVDTERNQDAINRVVSEYFGDHRPTSTLVEVVRLAPHPKLLLEMSAIAVVPD